MGTSVDNSLDILVSISVDYSSRGLIFYMCCNFQKLEIQNQNQIRRYGTKTRTPDLFEVMHADIMDMMPLKCPMNCPVNCPIKFPLKCLLKLSTKMSTEVPTEMSTEIYYLEEPDQNTTVLSSK